MDGNGRGPRLFGREPLQGPTGAYKLGKWGGHRTGERRCGGKKGKCAEGVEVRLNSVQCLFLVVEAFLAGTGGNRNHQG